MKTTSSKKLILLLTLSLNGLWFCEHTITPPMRAFIPGKILINEVLYDPVGNNTGNQLIELKNIGDEPLELKGWWFCARQDYTQIPDVTIGPGEFLVAHIGVNGTSTAKDVYLPFMLTLQSITDLNLYRDGNFTNPGSMVHYVQWGSVPPTNRLSEAITAGLWTAGDFVPGVAESHSIEYDGSGNLSTDWIDQPNPTIGF